MVRSPAVVITTAGLLTIDLSATAGSVVIVKVTSDENSLIYDTWQITVIEVAVEEILISPLIHPLSLLTGESFQFVAEIFPANSSNQNIIWSVSTGASISENGLLTVSPTAELNSEITVTAKSQQNPAILSTFIFTVDSIFIDETDYTLNGFEKDIYNDIQWYGSQVILTPIYPSGYTSAVITVNGTLLSKYGGVYYITEQGENNAEMYFVTDSGIATQSTSFKVYIDSNLTGSEVTQPTITVYYSSGSYNYSTEITNVVYTTELTFASLPVPNKISFSYTPKPDKAVPVSGIKGYEFALLSDGASTSSLEFTYISATDLSNLYTLLSQKMTVYIGTQSYLQFKGKIYLRAVSGAGSKGEYSSTNGIIIDNVQPAAPIIYALANGTVYTANTYTKENVSITLSSTGSVSGINKFRYRYRDVTSAQFTAWQDITLGATLLKNRLEITSDCERVYQFIAVSNSLVTGLDNISSITIKRDTVTPIISYVSGNPTDWVKTADLNFDITTGNSGVKNIIVWRGSISEVLDTTSRAYTVNQNGTYTITMQDNLNRTASFQIIVDYIEESPYTIYEFNDLLDALPSSVDESMREYIISLYDIYVNYSEVKQSEIVNLEKLTTAIQVLNSVKERSDTDTGVSAESAALPFNALLNVENISANSAEFGLINSRDSQRELLTLYNIDLTLGEENYNFDNVTFRLPVPAINTDENYRYIIVHINGSGALEYIEGTVSDGFISFVASAGGTYGIMATVSINYTLEIILIIIGAVIILGFATLFIIKKIKIHKLVKAAEVEKAKNRKIEISKQRMKMSEKFNPELEELVAQEQGQAATPTQPIVTVQPQPVSAKVVKEIETISQLEVNNNIAISNSEWLPEDNKPEITPITFSSASGNRAVSSDESGEKKLPIIPVKKLPARPIGSKKITPLK